MGSSQSKSSRKPGGKKTTDSNRDSPNQEKHNSADSKAPLTEHAAGFVLPLQSSVSRHHSSGEEDTTLTQVHTNTTANEIQSLPITTPNPSHTLNPVRSNNNSSTSGASPSQIEIHLLEGHSNVTRPPPTPRLRHLSELIDPADLSIDCHIRSPSGDLLAPEQFLVHPDRPRSIRERQEEIREKVRAASRLGVEVESAGGEKEVGLVRDRGAEKEKGRWGRWGCGCFGRSGVK